MIKKSVTNIGRISVSFSPNKGLTLTTVEEMTIRAVVLLHVQHTMDEVKRTLANKSLSDRASIGVKEADAWAKDQFTDLNPSVTYTLFE